MFAVSKAVVTAAGLGTRMRPLTCAVQKELLPLGTKPVLHRVLDEIAAAGLTDVAVVISPRRPAVREYLESQELPLRITFVYQIALHGLGDAVRCARYFVEDRPFLVALGDCLIWSERLGRPVRRLIEAAEELGRSCVLCEDVPSSEVSKYGVLVPSGTGERFEILDVVEKPAPDSAPSNTVIAGRYVFTPDLFRYLDCATIDGKGELLLSDAVRLMVRDGVPCTGVRLADGEHRVDIGGLKSYLEAFKLYADVDAAFCG
ncbi:MAG: sugar phosphate nucleotidyltransferase [Armatimonadota bacterium]